MSYQKELTVATKLVKNASRITGWFKEQNFRKLEKNDKTPVTLADMASQIYIISGLKKEFPNDQIIAEEESSLLASKLKGRIEKSFSQLNIPIKGDFKEILDYRGSSSQRKWTIDPVAGTK